MVCIMVVVETCIGLKLSPHHLHRKHKYSFHCTFYLIFFLFLLSCFFLNCCLLKLKSNIPCSSSHHGTSGDLDDDELSFFFLKKKFLNLKKRLQNSLVSKFYIQNGIHELRDATFPNKVNYGNNQGHQVPL
jgi:hypothetical protein